MFETNFNLLTTNRESFFMMMAWSVNLFILVKYKPLISNPNVCHEACKCKANHRSIHFVRDDSQKNSIKMKSH